MTKSSFSIAALLGLFAVSTASAQDAKTYKISIDRKPAKGDKTEERIEMKSKMSRLVTVEGTPQDRGEEKSDVSLSGVAEVLSVVDKDDKPSKDGLPTKIKFTVKKFEVTKNDETDEPLKEGDILIAEVKKGEAVFSVKGEEADAETAQMLGMLFELSKGEEPKGSEDKAFGTDVPRAVGAEWEVNAKELIATLPKDVPFELTPEGASGKVKFVGIKGDGDNKAYHMAADLTLKPTGLKNVPGEMKGVQSILNLAMDGLFPANEKSPVLEEDMKMDFEFSGTMNAGGAEASIKVKAAVERKVTRTAIK